MWLVHVMVGAANCGRTWTKLEGIEPELSFMCEAWVAVINYKVIGRRGGEKGWDEG